MHRTVGVAHILELLVNSVVDVFLFGDVLHQLVDLCIEGFHLTLQGIGDRVTRMDVRRCPWQFAGAAGIATLASGGNIEHHVLDVLMVVQRLDRVLAIVAEQLIASRDLAICHEVGEIDLCTANESVVQESIELSHLRLVSARLLSGENHRLHFDALFELDGAILLNLELLRIHVVLTAYPRHVRFVTGSQLALEVERLHNEAEFYFLVCHIYL